MSAPAQETRRVEFTPENKAAFDALLTRYPTKEAALLPGDGAPAGGGAR